MFKLQELISSKEYWLETTQNDVFRLVLDFQQNNGYDKAQLAKALGCTPRMTTQLLNGSINCSMEKLFDIITRMKFCPKFSLLPLDAAIKAEQFKRI